jgi:hypothetical protein
MLTNKKYLFLIVFLPSLLFADGSEVEDTFVVDSGSIVIKSGNQQVELTYDTANTEMDISTDTNMGQSKMFFTNGWSVSSDGTDIIFNQESVGTNEMVFQTDVWTGVDNNKDVGALIIGKGIHTDGGALTEWGRIEIVKENNTLTNARGAIKFISNVGGEAFRINSAGNMIYAGSIPTQATSAYFWVNKALNLSESSGKCRVLWMEGALQANQNDVDLVGVYFEPNFNDNGKTGVRHLAFHSTDGDVRLDAGDFIAGADNQGLILGLADDASIKFDGNSLNIVANAVTATDIVTIPSGVTVTIPGNASRTRTEQFLVEGYTHASDANNAMVVFNNLANDGNRRLFDVQTVGASKFNVDNDGDVVCGQSIGFGQATLFSDVTNSYWQGSSNAGHSVGTFQSTALSKGKIQFGDGSTFPWTDKSPAGNQNFDQVTIERDWDLTSTYTADGYHLRLTDNIINETGGTRGFAVWDTAGTDQGFIQEGGHILLIDDVLSKYGTSGDATEGFDGDSLNIVANAVVATDDLEITADNTVINSSMTVNQRLTLSTELVIPSGTTPTPNVTGSLFLDTDQSANGSLMCYSNGAWRVVADLP